MEKKIKTKLDNLCKGFPEEFAQYLNAARSMSFEDKPKYTYLKRILQQAMDQYGFENDNLYDWSKGAPKNSLKIQK